MTAKYLTFFCKLFWLSLNFFSGLFFREEAIFSINYLFFFLFLIVLIPRIFFSLKKEKKLLSKINAYSKRFMFVNVGKLCCLRSLTISKIYHFDIVENMRNVFFLDKNFILSTNVLIFD